MWHWYVGSSGSSNLLGILLGYSGIFNAIENTGLERNVNDRSMTGSKHGYSGQVISLKEGANKFYPVRVYDGEGNLKYELDAKQVKEYARKDLGKGKHWKTTAPK